MGGPQTRLIVVPIAVDSSDRVLLCRMAPGRGVFPGQWALPGGGVEPGEAIDDALRREVREELGVEIATLVPLVFKDAVLDKTYPDGRTAALHMVFLVYRCSLASTEIVLNEEFSDFKWHDQRELELTQLNSLTRATLVSAGLLSGSLPLRAPVL